MSERRFHRSRTAAGRRPHIPGADTDTREAVLAAARTIFARKGYDGASTREVAEAAGVNTAMIYYHFRDKIGLYRAVLTRSFAEFDRIWDDPVFASDAPSRKKLQTYIEGFIRFQQANDEIRRIMSMEFSSSTGNSKWLADKHFTVGYKKLVELMRESMRTGDMRRSNPSLAISCLVGMIIHSFAVQPMAAHVIGKDLDLDAKRFGKFVTDLFFDGLRPAARQKTAAKGPRI